MSLALPPLSTLDPTVFANYVASLTETLAAKYPQAALDRGALRDLLVDLGAASLAAIAAATDVVLNSTSVAAIAASPSTVDPAVYAAFLSNYRVAPLPGAAATGSVAITLSALVPFVVPGTATFSTPAATFSSVGPVVVRTSTAQLSSPTDVVLTTSGGGYVALIPVVCDTTSASGNAKRGDAFTASFAIPNLTALVAAGDFSGGVDPETTTATLTRLQNGVAARTFSSRGNVVALLTAMPEFAATLASIIGAGDPEMTRDQHSILPISLFGRCDVLVRTAATPVDVAFAKSATYVGQTNGIGTWRLAIARGDFPGFYEVARVAATTAAAADAGFVIVNDARGVDLTGSAWTPDVTTAAEGAYTAYQTALIDFEDPTTATFGLTPNASVGTYLVNLRGLPGIGDAQALLGGDAVRPAGGDVLVRAAVPAFVTLAASIAAKPGALAVDVVAVAAAATAAVNATSFSPSLYFSPVAAAISAALPIGATLVSLDMVARVRRLDGQYVVLTDPNRTALVVPTAPSAYLTGRTVAFYLDVDHVFVDMTGGAA